MKTAKLKTTEAVKNYIQLFPEEFEIFKKSTLIKRSLQSNDLATPEYDGVIKQHLGDIPETLDQMLSTLLTDIEWKWFISEKGSIWFFRSFKDFAVAKKI